MPDKVMSAKEAVQKFVKDGVMLRSGGIALRKPMALLHEVIRQRKREITFVTSGFTFDGDLMVGSGCITRLEGSYFGLEALGLSANYRRAQEKSIPHYVPLEEYTNYGMTIRYMAGAMGLPFFPGKGLLGSDIPKFSHTDLNKKTHEMDCPFTGERVMLLPAIHPDVAFLHAQRCDHEGNVQIWGQIGDDQWGTLSAKHIVVSVEEIVDENIVRGDPNRTIIPGFRVDAIVEAPFGAHPSQCQGYYDLDLDYKMMYTERVRTREGYLRYLEEWIHSVPDHNAYLDKVGRSRLEELRAKPQFCKPVNYGY